MMLRSQGDVEAHDDCCFGAFPWIKRKEAETFIARCLHDNVERCCSMRKMFSLWKRPWVKSFPVQLLATDSKLRFQFAKSTKKGVRSVLSVHPYRLLIHLGTHSRRGKLSDPGEGEKFFCGCRANYDYKSHTTERNAPESFPLFDMNIQFSSRSSCVCFFAVCFNPQSLMRDVLLPFPSSFTRAIHFLCLFLLLAPLSLPLSLLTHPFFFRLTSPKGRKSFTFLLASAFFPFSLVLAKN